MSDYIINFTDPLKGSFVIRPYTSNGPKFPTTGILNDTSIAENSTLLLFGKGHPEYGERTDENLLNLLENFSGATEPVIKVAGMLWHKEVLYYKDTGGGFYVAGDGSPLWSAIAVTPGAEPVSPSDGDYWWDNTGSPTVLYEYSADERNINDWIIRVFEEAAGVPTSSPIKEMQIYDGAAWDVLPDLTEVNSLIAASVGSYLLLDTSNGPLTGDLGITKVSPGLVLTGSDPVVELVGLNPTIQFRGATNYQVAGIEDGSPLYDRLEFRVGSAPGVNTRFEIDNTNDYLTHGNFSTPAAYALNVAAVDNALPNVKYVNDLVTGAILGDIFIDAGTFGPVGTPPTGTLTMPYSVTGSPAPASALVVPGFDSDNIPFTTGMVGFTEPASTVDEALTKCAPTNNPFFTGDVTLPAIGPSDSFLDAANKGYVDAQVAAVTASVSVTDALRSVQTGNGVGSPVILTTSFTVPFTYTAGNNRLMVFKNGVKQYKDELASALAIFSPTLFLDQTVFGLGPVGDYIITNVDVSGSPLVSTWTILGNYQSDFTAGDTFDVSGNSGSGDGTYTVVSATNMGIETDIVVTSIAGSPAATPDGLIGINYDFQLTVDGTGPLSVINVNSLNITDVSDLIPEIQAAIDAAFGAGVAVAYLHGGNIRIDSLSLPGGSPSPTVIISPTASPTTYLFAGTNLGIDGFSYFGGSSATSYAYFESDGGSPAGVAPSNSAASNIEFNVAPLLTDVIEFLLV